MFVVQIIHVKFERILVIEVRESLNEVNYSETYPARIAMHFEFVVVGVALQFPDFQ
jgi:BarA-like signal transduction histidine kinase